MQQIYIFSNIYVTQIQFLKLIKLGQNMSEPPINAFATLFNAAKKQNQDKPEENKQENSMFNLKPPGMEQVSRPVSRREAKTEYQSQIYTGINQVLQYESSKNKNTQNIFYVPCYIRLKINRVSQINYLQVSASIETQIRIWMMIKEFPKVVQDQILNLAKIQINGGDSIHSFADIPEPAKLDQSYKKNISRKSQSFMIVEEMSLDIESDPFFSPFQLVKLVAHLEIKKITLGDHDPDFLNKLQNPEDIKKYTNASIQFNFMDAHPFLNFSFGQVNHLGSFDIAQSLVDMQFSNEAIGADDDDELYSQVEENRPLFGNLIQDVMQRTIGLVRKIRRQKLLSGTITPDAYEHGKILIPLYKYPGMTIINVFVPFYMVAILSLGVFFQANDMSNRSASLATFQLAYIAFFPTIRETLPQTPKIVFAQILIYIQALCTLICFFYSLAVNMVQGYVFTWNTDVVFLICLSLTILNIAIVLSFMLLHKLCWEPAYNKLPDGAVQCMQQPSIDTDDPEEWWNPRCEEEFKDPMELNLVKPAFPHRKKKKKPLDPMAMLFGPKKVEPSQVHPS